MARTIMIAVLFLTNAALLLGANPAYSASLDSICTGSVGVVPGVGIGTLALGTSFVDAVRRLGPPRDMGVNSNSMASFTDPGWQRITRLEDTMHGRAYANFGSPFAVQIRATDNTIDYVSAWGMPSCADPFGIAANAAGSTVIDRYGQPDGIRHSEADLGLLYNAKGIVFGLDPKAPGLGPVLAMGVFRAGQFCQVFGQSWCARYTPPK